MARICLNPGHYPFKGVGYDPGAVNVMVSAPDGGMLTEGYVVRLIAAKVKSLLVAKGHDVFVWGAPTLKSITDKANNYGADLFVSLHCNALNGKTKGVEIFTYRLGTQRSRDLAHAIYNEIQWNQREIKRTPWYWRGEKRAGFYVIKNTKMPACLVEMGFIDNIEEAKEMLTLTWQNRMSEAIANGIIKFLEKGK